MTNNTSSADQITSARTAGEIRRTYSPITSDIDEKLVETVQKALAGLGLKDVYDQLLAHKLSKGELDEQVINVLITLENGLRQGLSPDDISSTMTDVFFTP